MNEILLARKAFAAVPVGTVAELRQTLDGHARAGANIRLAWSPEFLRESFAVEDTLRPDRIVLGIEDGDTSCEAVFRAVYADILAARMPLIVTDMHTANLIKGISASLDRRICFHSFMTSLTVQVGVDHLARLIKSPRAGLTELIWNALDADADLVDAGVEFSPLGAIETVLVKDNGHGMSLEDAKRGFGALGDSWKKMAHVTRGQGRQLHGEQGKGRFAAFALGDCVTWQTISRDDNGLVGLTIAGTRSNLSSFDLAEVTPERGEPGTHVRATNVSETVAKILDRDSLIDTLAAEFAIYLESYGHVQITWRGRRLDPASLQSRRSEYALDVTGILETPRLVIIEWERQVDRALYLCNESGMALHEIKPGIQAAGFEFTAYLKWDGFRGHDVLLAELGAEPMSSVVDAAKEKLRDHFKVRSGEKRQETIKKWVTEGSYPFRGEPATAIEKAEREAFDAVSFTAAKSVNAGDFSSRKLSLRLLREALESNPGNLHNVLRSVLELPEDRLIELDSLLNKTSLSSIITTSKRIGDRLSFLSGLDAILFDSQPRRETLERRQLHRILANETWIFGEEYAMVGDDVALTKVLEKYLARLGDDVDLAGASPVLRHDGTNPIPDLVFSRTCEIAQDRVENLVVELKRPSQTIGSKELTQIEEYALAVTRDERFNKPNVTWDFWIVGNYLDEFAESRRDQVGLPFGFIQRSARYSVRVLSWAEVINAARHRLKFVERSLNFRATHEDGVSYLQETHVEFLPPSLSGQR